MQLFRYNETSAVRKINMQQPRVGVPKYVTCCLLLQGRIHFLFYFIDTLSYPPFEQSVLVFSCGCGCIANTSGVTVCCRLAPTGEALWGTTWLHVTKHHAKHYIQWMNFKECDDMALFRSVQMKKGLDKRDKTSIL